MILSDRDILSRLADGDLVIEPLDDIDLQVQPASVDLRLGREFLEFQRTNIPCIHPRSEREVDEYVTETVADGEFVLHPGDFVLGTTVERVEIPPDLIAHVEGRSSLGRLAVVVHASLPYDEEVFLWTPTDGFGFYEIGAIVEAERPARAVAFDPRTLRVSTHRVTDYLANPAKRIFRVRLASGRSVRVTRDHNLFTLDAAGGVTRVPSGEAEGTAVMVPAELPASPSPVETLDLHRRLEATGTVTYAADGAGSASPVEALDGLSGADSHSVGLPADDGRLPRELSLTPDLGWLIGLYISAGRASAERVLLAHRDREPLERAAECLETHGVPVTWSSTPDDHRLVVRSGLWARLCRSMCGETGAKTLPGFAFNWPEPVQSGLLDGLLAGVGGTPGALPPVVAGRAQYLATGLDRRSIARSEMSPNGPGSLDPDWPSNDPIPVPEELLRSLRESAGLSQSAVSERLDATIDVAALEAGDRGTMPRDILGDLRSVYGRAAANTGRLDQILEGGVRFERVVAVTSTDRVEPTYDLEVQPGGRPIENFLGGRGGVFLSNTAGLCDPGYRGQITLELSNLGTAPVALEPGMRVSQLTFTELSSPAKRPYGSDRGSKYQNQEGPQASRVQSDPEFEG